MPEEPLFERLRRELEAPPLAAPSPSQARYAGISTPGAGWRWVKLGGAFAAGAVATGLLMTAGTGSPDPQVWTIRVASALSQLGEPRPEATPSSLPAASPSPRPVLTPAPDESETAEPSTEPAGVASPGEIGERSGDRSSSGPEILPSASPEARDGGTDGSGGTSGSGGTDGGGTEGGSTPSPSPSPSPGGNH